MATRKTPTPALEGRKAAYVARNRVALLRSTQKVLAEIGPDATIEQISEMAEVSVSTIYKHFENKDVLFATATIEAMRDWELWVDQFLSTAREPLEELVLPMRALLRIPQTHPLYARMIANNLSAIPDYVPGISSGLSKHIKELIKAKVLDMESPEIRIQSVSATLLAALSHQLLNPKARNADADVAVEIALGILGVSPSKAKKLAQVPLPAFGLADKH